MVSAAVVIRPFGRPLPPAPAAGPRAIAFALHLTAIAGLTLVLASSGAFDSDRLPLPQRALMFGVVSTLLIGQASLLAGAALRIAGSNSARRAAAAALALGATLLLMTVELHLLKATPLIPYEQDPLPEFALFLAPFVGPVGALVLGLRWFSAHRDEGPTPRRAEIPVGRPEPPAEGPAPTPSILRVQAVDHYLNIWTDGRTRLVRGRMGDALDRLAADVGIQPHRSWWIARSEILRMERRGRDHRLVLRDGSRVPVARARVAEVRRFLVG